MLWKYYELGNRLYNLWLIYYTFSICLAHKEGSFFSIVLMLAAFYRIFEIE